MDRLHKILQEQISNTQRGVIAELLDCKLTQRAVKVSKRVRKACCATAT